MSNLTDRPKRLQRRLRPPCPCRSRAIPIIGPDELVDEGRVLLGRCVGCGRTIRVRCIIVVRRVDPGRR